MFVALYSASALFVSRLERILSSTLEPWGGGALVLHTRTLQVQNEKQQRSENEVPFGEAADFSSLSTTNLRRLVGLEPTYRCLG